MSGLPDYKPEKTPKKQYGGIRRTKPQKEGVLSTQDKNKLESDLLKALWTKMWQQRPHYCEECLFEVWVEEGKDEDKAIEILLGENSQSWYKTLPIIWAQFAYLGETKHTYNFHHPLEKGRRAFEHLALESINNRIKCANHHHATTSGHISRYEELMRRHLLNHFIKLGKLPDKDYEDFFKS